MYRFFLITFFSLLSYSRIYAINVGRIDQPVGTISIGSTATNGISSIIAYAIGIAAILGVIGITWGGIQMILATGEDEKMKKARYIMIYSIVGVILAGLAYSIVSIIGELRI